MTCVDWRYPPMLARVLVSPIVVRKRLLVKSDSENEHNFVQKPHFDLPIKKPLDPYQEAYYGEKFRIGCPLAITFLSSALACNMSNFRISTNR